MRRSEQLKLLSKVTYKPGWELRRSVAPNGEVVIQWFVRDGVCASTGKASEWASGKRALSAHSCRQEVVGAAFALALAAEEHECREWFRYDGASIYNPHLDPDQLAQLARNLSAFNVRDNAMVPA